MTSAKDVVLYIPASVWRFVVLVARVIQKMTAEMPSRRVYLLHKRIGQAAMLYFLATGAWAMWTNGVALRPGIRVFGAVVSAWFVYNIDVGWHRDNPERICTGCGRLSMEPNGDAGHICATCGNIERG
jgi:hypothetical protein